MAFIEKRKGRHGVSYRVRVRDPHKGELTSKTFTTRKAAQDWLHTQEGDKARGSYRSPDAGKEPLGELVDAFIGSAVDLAPATVALYRSVADNHVLPRRLAARSVASIRPQDLRDWMAELHAAGVGVPTIRVARRLVTRVLQQAKADGLVVSQPADAAPPPRDGGQPEIRVLEPREVRAIADAVDSRYRALVLTQAYCGLRFGEVAALRRGDLDILRRRCTISRALAEVRGTITEGITKSGRIRTVTMPKLVAEALAEHLTTHDGDLVFPAPDGGYIRRTNWRRRVWAPALERVGISGVTPHDLRHFGAAVAIAAGAHPKAIQERLGHASIVTTLNVYGHLFPSLDEELAARLDQMARDSTPASELAGVVAIDRT